MLTNKRDSLKGKSGIDKAVFEGAKTILYKFSGLFSRNKKTIRKLIQEAQGNELIMLKIKEMMRELDVVTTETESSGPTEEDVTTEAKEEAKELLVKIATKIDAKVGLS